MRAVGIKVLKNRLSEYVRMAAQGETILVSDRERVVAELGPPHNRPSAVGDAVLAELIREGVVTPARVGPGPLPRSPGVMKLAELLNDLDADRAD